MLVKGFVHKGVSFVPGDMTRSRPDGQCLAERRATTVQYYPYVDSALHKHQGPVQKEQR